MLFFRKLTDCQFSLAILISFFMALLKPMWFLWAQDSTLFMLALMMYALGCTVSWSRPEGPSQSFYKLLLALFLSHLILPCLALIWIVTFDPAQEVALQLILLASGPTAFHCNAFSLVTKQDPLAVSILSLASILSVSFLFPWPFYFLGTEIPHFFYLTRLNHYLSWTFLPFSFGVITSFTCKNSNLPLQALATTTAKLSMLALLTLYTSMHITNLWPLQSNIALLIISYTLSAYVVGLLIAHWLDLHKMGTQINSTLYTLRNTPMVTSASPYFNPAFLTYFEVGQNLLLYLLTNRLCKLYTPPILIFSQILTPRKFTAITLYPFIVCRDRSLLSPILLNHEKIHLAQQKELAFLGFYVLYLLQYVFNLFLYRNRYLAYRNIIFEKEAYRNQHDLDYLQKRRPWAFLKHFC